jgi:hypothetical protein
LIIAAAAVLLFGSGSAQRRFGNGGPFGDSNSDDNDGTVTLKAALKRSDQRECKTHLATILCLSQCVQRIAQE